MFRVIKWTFWITFWVILGAFLHYTLPQKDVVRIVNTYEERQDLGDWTRIFWSDPDDQSVALSNRDVQFIQAVRPDGSPMVYRNEDTGWGWPPYFKLDTANLYTEANDAVSTKAAPEWYIVKHYGWRNFYLSIFPNAISIKQVDGPDASKGIPFLNIFVLTLIAAFFWAIYVRWRRFRQSRIDPTLEAIEDDLAEKGGAVRRWFGTWKSKS
ncbi:DUF1523 family protein [Sulfitobacter sp. JBTF-M27]|jgi:hypothetical protein|uniref:DUF1523 family protein n=1 Tax=Sulfitobacter sediminilitoris TaxID=2698830 RepID=A0A6P0C9D1_9RHOB|nr:DUF1523 family protein [Sulfitobacter sediminilitoris]NEK21775.1 DUF1523 family protein [Sulfitobacter sediminilitoris]